MGKFSQIIFRSTSEIQKKCIRTISFSEYLAPSEPLFQKLKKIRKTRNTNNKFNDV